MRKKHQAIHISTNAKKNFCKEINLSDYTYEEEIKEQLSDYFNDNLKDEDIENIEDKREDDSDDDSFEVSQISVPKKDIKSNEFAKFQISEKAIISSMEDYNYELIPQKTINIGINESEKVDENNRDIGDNIKLDEIIKQYIYWLENCDKKDKEKSDIDPLELFNLDVEKIKKIKEKIEALKKIAKDKKMNEPMLNKLLKEIETKYTEQIKELNNLVSKVDKIDSISYGKHYSIVEYKK